MKLYLSSAIVESRNLESVSFEQYALGENGNKSGCMTLYYYNDVIKNYHSSNIKKDKKILKNHFRNLVNKQNEKK